MNLREGDLEPPRLKVPKIEPVSKKGRSVPGTKAFWFVIFWQYAAYLGEERAPMDGDYLKLSSESYLLLTSPSHFSSSYL